MANLRLLQDSSARLRSWQSEMVVPGGKVLTGQDGGDSARCLQDKMAGVHGQGFSRVRW